MFKKFSFQRRNSLKRMDADTGDTANTEKLDSDSGVVVVSETPVGSPTIESDEDKSRKEDCSSSTSTSRVENDDEIIDCRKGSLFPGASSTCLTANSTQVTRNLQSSCTTAVICEKSTPAKNGAILDQSNDNLRHALETNGSIEKAVEAVFAMEEELIQQGETNQVNKKKKSTRRKRIRSLSDSDSDACCERTPMKKCKPSTCTRTETSDILLKESINDKAHISKCLSPGTKSTALAKLKEVFPGKSEDNLSLVFFQTGSLEDAILVLSDSSSEGVFEQRLLKNKRREHGDKDNTKSIVISDEETSEIEEVYSTGIINDLESNGDDDEHLTATERASILSFFEDCSIRELASIPGCSQKKAEKITKLKPFKSWNDLVTKLDSTKGTTSQIVWDCKTLLDERLLVDKLMQRCKQISDKIQEMLLERVDDDQDPNDSLASISGLISQPEILNNSCQLKPYQLTGLNWLILMHEQECNGILADEMGLGKTIQAIAFIAHLIEQGQEGPHLIIVPSSTVNNWVRELKHWCPTVEYVLYYGSQEDRLYLREEMLSPGSTFQVVITTYNIAISSTEDWAFFRKLKAHYVIFDEGHMLKNMQSQRYQKLARINAKRRLLLTGTPLQNNLLELMSLLSFVMPCMFGESAEGLKLLFSTKKINGEEESRYEKERAEQAKRIMKPFVLRRLKKDVLQQLPQKHEQVIMCELSAKQRQLYDELFMKCYREFKEPGSSNQYKNILMALRMMCNHPLLLRNYYLDSSLVEMARKYCRDLEHRGSEPDLVYEDMTVMSDFELNRLCLEERTLASHSLDRQLILDSGKFEYLSSVLPEMKNKGDRVLLFSQFTLAMDIIEVYLQSKGYRYIRLDGQTPVVERQDLIDKYNSHQDIFIFLLSTRAGGLGINLTSANTVILHDIDFNPYNDKQAEDRCHRVGQTRDVHVYKLIAKGTIEENILKCANSKLKLEKDVVSGKDEGPIIESLSNDDGNVQDDGITQ